MNLLEKFKQVKVFAFDVDGVLTDGMLYVFDDGEQVRRMNIKDGFALQLAIQKGYKVVAISGSVSPAVVRRLNKLGIDDVFMEVINKKDHLQHFIQQHGLNWENILFMGDDIPDYYTMKQAGVACAPVDAVYEIKKHAHYISSKKGGEGCVRDVIEKVLKVNDQWELETNTASL